MIVTTVFEIRIVGEDCDWLSKEELAKALSKKCKKHDVYTLEVRDLTDLMEKIKELVA